jgi:GH18 family chitinase
MQRKNLKNQENPEKKKSFSGFFYALAALPSESKTTGKMTFSLGGWGFILGGVQCLNIHQGRGR